MQKLILFLFLLAISAASNSLPVFTHTLKIENEVGVTLHIDPDDDPIAGAESVFYPKINDKTDKFKISDCDCRVSISQGSNTLFQTILIPPQTDLDSKETSFKYTFPSKGTYQLEMSGSSFSKSFNNFQVKYDLNINRQVSSAAIPIENKGENNTPKPTNQTPFETTSYMSFVQYAIFAGGFGFILIISTLKFVNRQKNKRRDSVKNK
jgi:hypothetical protein